MFSSTFCSHVYVKLKFSFLGQAGAWATLLWWLSWSLTDPTHPTDSSMDWQRGLNADIAPLLSTFFHHSQLVFLGCFWACLRSICWLENNDRCFLSLFRLKSRKREEHLLRNTSFQFFELSTWCNQKTKKSQHTCISCKGNCPWFLCLVAAFVPTLSPRQLATVRSNCKNWMGVLQSKLCYTVFALFVCVFTLFLSEKFELAQICDKRRFHSFTHARQQSSPLNSSRFYADSLEWWTCSNYAKLFGIVEVQFAGKGMGFEKKIKFCGCHCRDWTKKGHKLVVISVDINSCIALLLAVGHLFLLAN